MALLETRPATYVAWRPPGRALVGSHRPAATYLVPDGGVLEFPGVPEGVAPPAQVGPLMTPPGRAVLYGR